jgi:non-homologous end joining protein Ku
MADLLVTEMSRDFDWEGTTDPVKGQLSEVVRRKIDGGEVTGAPVSRAVPAATTGADLMAALAKSVADAKAAKAPAPPVRKPRSRKAAA